MDPGARSQAQHHTAHLVLLTNSLTPWFRTHVDVQRGRLQLDTPRTFLGIVPLGRSRIDVPVGDVRRAEVGSQLRPERLVAAAALVATTAVAPVPASIVAALVAVWLAALSWISVLRVRTEVRAWAVPICVLARRTARRAAERILWIAERAP